ncbi:BrnA antitoxin family protein [Treponema socranskii]
MKFIPNGAKRKKTEIHLQIDTDVLEWYKSQGRGYQTKMNDVLRAHAFLQRGAEH